MRIAAVIVTYLVCVGACTPILSIDGVAGDNGQLLSGVNAGPGSYSLGSMGAGPTTYDFTTEYQLAGVTWVRTHDFYGVMDMTVLWPDRTLDPSVPANFDFTGTTAWDFDGDGVDEYYDSTTAFETLVDGGFMPYLRIGDSYNNALTHGMDFGDPKVRADYATAAVTVVQHFYSNAGTFGCTFTDGYVEIWNEPDNTDFWDPNAHSTLDFFRLYEAVADALRARFPDLHIGGPGYTPAGYRSSDGQALTQEFLDYCVANSVPLDFFSWHMYSNDPADFTDAAAWYRSELDARRLTGTESHLSEWNLELNGSLTGTWRGAVTAAIAWMDLQRDGNVDAAMVYRGAEAGTGVPGRDALFYESSGVAYANPIGEVFALLGRFSQFPERIDIKAGSEVSPDLEFLGAADSSMPQTAILIANPTSSSKDWVPFFLNDASCLSATGAVMRVMTASATTTPYYAGPVAAQTISARSVQLAIIDCMP